ncbi:MAG: DNA primase [Janthinobacterium lividum]
MARIPKETVDQILHTADILEVVGDYVPLKRNGQNYWACCPFHNEKSPSFSVTPSKGFYKCFGCGKSGNVVGFVMDVEGSSYPEALRQLAKKYGIGIPEEEERTPEEQLRQNERDSQYIVSNWAKEHYHRLLQNTEEGMGVGYAYLKERGLNLTTIQTFELGYSLDLWDDLLKSAEKDGYQLKYLEKTGLVIKREDDQGHDTGRRYDRFRGRVMFPIHNVSGRVVGFGARTLKRDDKTAKYLNSPESDIYHKSDVLYGLFQARQSIRSEESCFLVEGYLDVLSLHQGGIKNVVASSGTSLTEGQIRLIKRYSENVTVLYDGDAAGIKASLRGIDLLLEGGLNVRVVLFPDGDDPDSYIRKVGDQRFAAYIEEQSQDFIAFKTTLVAREASHDPVKKAEAIREVLQSIAKVPDGLKRQVFLQQTASTFGFDEQVIITEYNKLLKALPQSKKAPDTPAAPTATAPPVFTSEEEAEAAMYGVSVGSEATANLSANPATTAELGEVPDVLTQCEQAVLRLLVLYGPHEVQPEVTVAHYLLSQLDGTPLQNPLYARLWAECREAFLQGQLPDLRQLAHHPDAEVRSLLADFATQRYDLSPNWRIKDIYVPTELNLIQLACDNAILRLNKCHVQRERQQCLTQLNDVRLDSNEQLNVLLRYNELTKLDNQLAQMLGTVVARGA